MNQCYFGNYISLIGNRKDPFWRNGELECLVGASKLKRLQQVK